MVSLSQIGIGYWGKNLLRNFKGVQKAKVKRICDVDVDLLRNLSREYDGIETTSDAGDVFEDSEIEAVAIATPAESHFDLARKSLESGKHTFVEKPLALSAADCMTLIELARQKKKILMVGHTFVYNAAVNTLKRYLEEQELGDVYYIYSQRLNLGRIRDDINAMWNFAPHDISIILHCLNQLPTRVSARGYDYIQEGVPDVVYVNLDFKSKISAQIHVSWLDPNKVRRMTFVGSRKMIVYDDVATNAKIQIYDKGITKKNMNAVLGDFDSFGKFQLIHRAGDLLIPNIDFVEPLKVQCSHFVDCVARNLRPLTPGESGWVVVKVLEAAQESLENEGTFVDLNWGDYV